VIHHTLEVSNSDPGLWQLTICTKYHAASIVMCLKEILAPLLFHIFANQTGSYYLYCHLKFICEFSIIYEPPNIYPHELFEYSASCSTEIYKKKLAGHECLNLMEKNDLTTILIAGYLYRRFLTCTHM
jgi:hypothetical protein